MNKTAKIIVILKRSFSAPLLVLYIANSPPKVLPKPDPLDCNNTTIISKTPRIIWIKFKVGFMAMIISRSDTSFASVLHEQGAYIIKLMR